MSFSDNLKAAMEERQVTQTQLAGMVGISKSSISQYLSGKHEPINTVAKRIADALETSVDYLMGKGNVSMDVDSKGTALKNVPVEQAARLLGKSKQFVRVALQRGVAPFGFAVMGSGEKWSYHISPRKLTEYIGALN